jgi:hypothetical protein
LRTPGDFDAATLRPTEELGWAYSERLASRIRNIRGKDEDVDGRKMFGGLAFMVRGHICCGVIRDDFMLRLGPDRAEDAPREKHSLEVMASQSPPDTRGGGPRRMFVYSSRACDLSRNVHFAARQCVVELPTRIRKAG